MAWTARRAAAALAATCALFVLATALRLPAAWGTGNALNHVSGVWMTLADDFARGVLYRPLYAPGTGYGGTRYFPLAFVVQGGLVRMGAPLLAAGYAASLAAALLLVMGMFLFLRALGIAPRHAAPFAALALAGFAGQYALTAVRGDLLPVALSALGITLVVRPRPARMPLAALLFALAFTAKPAALTAAGAALLFLVLRRAPKAAFLLAAHLSVLVALAVAAIDTLSGGRFLESLKEFASAGANAATALRAPVRFGEELALADPAGLVLAVAAAGAFAGSVRSLADSVRAGKDDPRLLPALWLAAAGAGALAVLSTPGTGVNHFLELEAASAGLLATCFGRPDRAGSIARAGAPAAAVAALTLALAIWHSDRSASRLAEIREVAQRLPAGAPILSEDPLVPLLAGERPFLLDPFMIRLATAHAPERCAPLVDALRRGTFPAIVLFQDLDSPAADSWYEDGNLGLPLAGEIRRRYRHAASVGRYNVYVPRAEAAGVAGRKGPG